MSEISKSKEFTPWDYDEIEFVSGNWTVKRSRFDGMYDYSFNDVEASAPVDAFQLIKWGMAKLKTYDALLPWDATEITFAAETEIMRDLTDTSTSVKSRKYLVRADGKYLKCNSYYLVQKGLAEPSSKFITKLEKSKLKLKKNEKILWESDGLIILPTVGVTVNAGSREGLYRVARNGITLNYSAARIIEEGLGISVYDYKLNSLEKHVKTTWSAYRKDLADFWLSENAEAIKTMREVAVIWDGMEHNPDDAHLQKILQYNQGIAQGINEQRENAEFIRGHLGELYELKSKYSLITKEINDIHAKLYQRFDLGLNVLTDQSDFAGLCEEFYKKTDELKAWKEKLQTVSVAASIRYNFASLKLNIENGASPITCVPQNRIKAVSVELNSSPEALQAVQTELTKATDDFNKELSTLTALDTEFTKVKEQVGLISKKVAEINRRKYELDKFKREQLGYVNYFKGPGLFCKPHKYDSYIVFTTNAKIKKAGDSRYYTVKGKSEDLSYVTAIELIYLGLARSK